MFQNMKKLISIASRSRRNLAISFGSLIVLSTGLGYTSYEATKETVSFNINGEHKVIRTHANTVADFLEDYHIQTRSEDDLTPSLDTRIKDDLTITLDQAKPVEITVNNKERTVWTTAKTVKDLLEAEQIKVSKHDVVKPGLDTEIDRNMDISVDKAFQFTLNVGGKVQRVWSTSTTVADFLEQHKIKVNKLDRIEPSLDAVINENSTIKVIRVEKVTDVVEEPIDYAVVTKKDSRLAQGNKRVIHPGEEGRVAKQYEIIKENGKIVSKRLINKKILKDSIDRVVAVGTKANSTYVSRGSQVSSEFYVSSTAFTSFCSGCSGRTATGINLRANPHAKVIAVDPSVIPLGTKVYVEGYGYAVAGDIGSAINGYKIDVFFPSQSEAYRWGTRRVKIKILK